MGDRSVSARDISRSVVVTGDGNNVALTKMTSGPRADAPASPYDVADPISDYFPVSPNKFPVISHENWGTND
jgi:hypothetical protein